MAAGKSAAAAREAWLVFEDEAGQSMRPPRARTWGRVGCTPVVRVRGRGAGRVSMAGLSCYKPGQRSRMLYSFHVYRGRKGEKKGLTWQDYRDLLIRAHIQLGGPIVLVWDNLRAHLMPPMREFIEASKDWLTVFQRSRRTRLTSTRKRASGRWSSAPSATSPLPISTSLPEPSSGA
ncbi:transposase [Kitasatospora sp. NPDC059408]|uniref:transposase n=1 Tax=Kitasatospora sp. NPDC059408 TaxID=3346823 RepID=UPI0036C0FC7C